MAKKYPLALGCLVLSLILLHFAYLTLTSNQPMIFLDEKGQPLSSPNLIAWFRIASWGALAFGLLLVMYAIRTYVSTESKAHTEATDSAANGRLLEPRRIWLVLNVILIAISVWTGYVEMSSSVGRRSDADLIFCAAIIILIPVFAIGAAHLSQTHNLRKPTLDRFPLNWWGDPLQALFIGTLSTLGLVIGSLFRFCQSGMLAVQTIAVYASMFVGLILGQRIVYLLYRSRIK